MKTVGSVYFIVQEDDEGDFHPDINTPIKVGISTNIKTRLSNLQTGNPNRLFLLGWITTIEYKKLEKELHQQLIGEKIRGEWFELDSHIVIEILKQNNGNLVREREQLTFLGYDRDGIPEFLGVWDWWDFDPEECCPYCGSFSGMYFHEQLQSDYCISCDTVEAWENPESFDPEDYS